MRTAFPRDGRSNRPAITGRILVTDFPGDPGGDRMYRLYLIPTLIINVAIVLIPALLTVLLAFYHWDGISTPTFAGIDNFSALWNDPVFWVALENNIIWTGIFLIVPIAMGLVAASMLLIVRRGSNFFQVVFFLPVVIATVITARVWQGMIYSPVTG